MLEPDIESGTKHTPELWKQLIKAENWAAAISQADGIPPGHCDYMNKSAMARAGARIQETIEPIGVAFRDADITNLDRVSACVNACAGINPEAVPELLEAAKHVIGDLSEHGAATQTTFNKLKAAITKAGKGSK